MTTWVADPRWVVTFATINTSWFRMGAPATLHQAVTTWNLGLGSETYPNRIFGNACTLLMREIMGIELGETGRNLKILDTILQSCQWWIDNWSDKCWRIGDLGLTLALRRVNPSEHGMQWLSEPFKLHSWSKDDRLNASRSKVYNQSR